MKKIGFLLLVLSFMVSSCKDESMANYKPVSVGQRNAITVVMSNDLWKGKVGDKVRERFAAPVVGIATEEPIFNLRHLPEDVFTGRVKNSRSVLFFQKNDSTNMAYLRKDAYASPQNVGVVVGKTDEAIIKGIEEKADSFISAFKKVELEESQKAFLRSLSEENPFEEEFGVSIDIPSVYTVGKHEKNFIWMDREIRKGNMNIIAYTLPSNYFKVDSTFAQDIVHMRDSIGEKYIPGSDVPNKKNFMISEKAFSPHINPAEVGGKKAAEIRGRWEMSAYIMAGPYLTYIINDKENDRKLVVEGFVFAPATAKRDYMFELESIIKTIKFKPKQEIQ